MVATLPCSPEVFHGASTDLRSSISALGFAPIALILLRAYSMGGGTYTGIEAVSNGVTMLREPRVRTGKKTMSLMATSLAFTAGGILLGYLLVKAAPAEVKTMNAVLMESLYGPGNFKGGEAVGQLEAEKRKELAKYVAWARQHGLAARSRRRTGQPAAWSSA